MPNELYEIKIKSIGYTDDVEIREEPKKVAGKNLGRKTVGSDKIINVSSVEDNSITQAMLQDAVVGKAELRYEQVSITISGTNTSGTVTVTVDSIPFGYFLSAFTTPTASYIQLAVSSTTLTATLSAAPGAGNSITIQIVLLKA